MKRSDGALAIGIGRCINTVAFNPRATTKGGDKCILYSDGGGSVSGPESCTWGTLGRHYELLYEFPASHKRRRDIIQQIREIDYEA